jgi:hypothetical protein
VSAFIATLMTAPFMFLAFGGVSGFTTFVRESTGERSYHLVSHSLWGTSSLLFSDTGWTTPLLISDSLRMLIAGVLCVVVISLMLLALWTPGDTTLCTWNIAGGLVLLLPMVHLAYSVLLLPLMWTWCARAVRVETRSLTVWLVVGVSVVWWLIQTQSWGDDYFSPSISVWSYCTVFLSNFVFCATSIIGNWYIQRSGRKRSVTDSLAVDGAS